MNTLLKVVAPVVAVLSFAGAANAVEVLGVHNTGVAADGSPLAAGDGVTDPNYTIVSSANESLIGQHALTYYNTAYLQDGPASRIVNATGDGNGVDNETTTFATTFDLTGYNPVNATISGQVLFDNSGEIFLNGNQIGGTVTGYTSLTPFGTNMNFFNAGINTLTFVLHNDTGPTAFQVAGLTVTDGGAVPEPASWALMVVGFGMVGASLRRRKTVVATA